MSDVETIERDWDALLGESAERDWNALLGESGCAVKMLNRRRGKEPGRWLYELSVVPEIGVFRAHDLVDVRVAQPNAAESRGEPR